MRVFFFSCSENSFKYETYGFCTFLTLFTASEHKTPKQLTSRETQIPAEGSLKFSCTWLISLEIDFFEDQHYHHQTIKRWLIPTNQYRNYQVTKSFKCSVYQKSPVWFVLLRWSTKWLWTPEDLIPAVCWATLAQMQTSCKIFPGLPVHQKLLKFHNITSLWPGI